MVLWSPSTWLLLLHVALPFHIFSLSAKAGWTSTQHGNQIPIEGKWKLPGLSRAKPKTHKAWFPLHSTGIKKSEGQPGFKRWINRFHFLMREKASMYRKKCWQSFFFFFKRNPKPTYTSSHRYSWITSGLSDPGILIAWQRAERQVDPIDEWIQKRKRKKVLLQKFPIASPKLINHMSSSLG